MNREQKAAVIDEIADELGSAGAIIALDYRGITVAQIAELREKLRATDTKLRVAKNSLSERAADQAGVTDIKPLLVGPTALALVKGDAAAAAKVLSDTARALRGPLAFKGGVLDGVSLSPAEVETIAKLPSRDVLNAMLVGTIAAPLTGLARTLNALIQGLASQLGQIRDQGLVTGAAAPSEAAAASSANDNELASEAPAAAEETTEAATAATDESEPEAPAEADAPEASEPEKPAEAEADAAPSAEPAEPETETATADGATEADSSSAEEAPTAEAQPEN
jgi:large subunit ribosomal protein L10